MIYAIQAGERGPIKFGLTESPDKRLRELQTGNPETLRLLCAAEALDSVERLIHAHLSKDGLAGEWFLPSVSAWNVVWAIERQCAFPGSREIVEFIAACNPGALELVSLVPETGERKAVVGFDRSAYMLGYMRKKRLVERIERLTAKLADLKKQLEKR